MAKIEEEGASVGSMLPVTPVSEVLTKTVTTESVDNEFAALALDDTKNNPDTTDPVELPDGIPPADDPMNPAPSNPEEAPATPEEIAQLQKDLAVLEEFQGVGDLTEDESFMEGANTEIHKEFKYGVKIYTSSIKDVRRALHNKDYNAARKHVKTAKYAANKTKHAIDNIQSGLLETVAGIILNDCIVFLENLASLLTDLATTYVANRYLMKKNVPESQMLKITNPAYANLIHKCTNLLMVIKGMYDSYKKKGFTTDMLNTYKQRCMGIIWVMDKSCDVITKDINNLESKHKAKAVKESADDPLAALDGSMDTFFEDVDEPYMEGANSEIMSLLKSSMKTYKENCKKAKAAYKKHDYDLAIKYAKIAKKELDTTKKEVSKIESTVGEAIIGIILQSLITTLKSTVYLLAAAGGGAIGGGLAGLLTGDLAAGATGGAAAGLGVVGYLATFINGLIDGIKWAVGAYDSFKKHGVTADLFNTYKSTVVGHLDVSSQSMNAFINRCKEMKKGTPFKESAGVLMTENDRAYLESGMETINKMLASAGICDYSKITGDTYVYEEAYHDAVGEEAFTEGATESEHNPNIDDDIKPIIKKLNEKGYKTVASCSGHPSARRKDDRFRDGVRYGKLYSSARVVFDKVYDFPSIPEGWQKKVMEEDNRVGIYVTPPTFKIVDGLPEKNYENWKRRYMRSLEKWADELPKEGEAKEADDPKLTLESVIEDILVDAMVGV